VTKTTEAASSAPTDTKLSRLLMTPAGRLRWITVCALILGTGIVVYLLSRAAHERDISSYDNFITQLQSEIRDLAEANTKHVATITDLQRQVEKAEAELHAIMPSEDTYSVAPNQSLPVAAGQLTIGLVGTPTTQRANINVNGEQRSVVAGDVIYFSLNSSTTCKVGVQSFDMFKANLTATCATEKPQ